MASRRFTRKNINKKTFKILKAIVDKSEQDDKAKAADDRAKAIKYEAWKATQCQACMNHEYLGHTYNEETCREDINMNDGG